MMIIKTNNKYNLLLTDVKDLLETFYGETHRKYHTINHVNNCLKELDVITELNLIDKYNSMLIGYAILFHFYQI